MVIEQVKLVVPWLGESITEAVVARWLKSVGKPSKPTSPWPDLETDKVNVQVMAPSAGVLTEQLVAEGATVKVGQSVGTLAVRPTGAQARASSQVPPPPAPQPTPSAQPAQAPATPMIQPGVQAAEGGGGAAAVPPAPEPAAVRGPDMRLLHRSAGLCGSRSDWPRRRSRRLRAPQATMLGLAPQPEGNRLEEVVR